jgi:hypothetical protein
MTGLLLLEYAQQRGANSSMMLSAGQNHSTVHCMQCMGNTVQP